MASNHKLNELNEDNGGSDSYMMGLETFLLARRLQQHQKTSNKVDKGFASMLLELTDTVANFLEKATVEDDFDGEAMNLMNIIPSVENSVFLASRMYYCSACSKNIKATAQALNEHFLSDTHLKHLKSFAKSNDKQSNAMSSKPVDKKKERNSVPALLKEIGVKENLPRKFREFVSTTDITFFTRTLVSEAQQLKMSGQHDRISRMLKNQLYFRYPQIKVYPFGSLTYGLGNKGSDLDIFIDTENCFYKRLPKRKMKDAIYQVQRILTNFPHQWDNFEPVVHARTPILRAYCVAENIDCDFSFSNGLSTCNTALITYFVEIQPIIKQIIIFLKYCAQKLVLGVNSYLLTLMVIFYFQQENLLPPVKLLQEKTEQIRIDGWNANFETFTLPQLQMPLATDLKKYVLGLFKFYGFDFDYTNYVICVLTGTRVPKHFFDHGREHQLPPEFKSFAEYMSKIDVDEADEVEDLFSNHKPIVIQDPFELIHNVAKGIQEQKLCKIISFFRSTHELLINAKF